MKVIRHKLHTFSFNLTAKKLFHFKLNEYNLKYR